MHMLLTILVTIEGGAGKINTVVVTNLSFNCFFLLTHNDGTRQSKINFYGLVLMN